jgi:hypothetical protein
MRALFLLCSCVFGLVLAAQPAFDRNYCGFAPNDSIDITNDGIPDLVVQGFRIGTDDEPSSSGNCSLHVMNLPGTVLLTGRYGQGYRHLKTFAKGDTVTPALTERIDDLYIPELAYADGSIRVAHWGYGHQSALPEVPEVLPHLTEQFYVFRTMGRDRVWQGSFSIAPPGDLSDIRIRVGALVPSDQAFIVR